MMLSPAGTQSLLDSHHQVAESHSGAFHEAESLQAAALTDMLQEMIDRGHEVQAVPVYKGWAEVDTFEDYRKAWKGLS